MTEIIARCGYRCDLCAARSDDPELRQKLVDGWREIYGHQRYTADNVRCDGCLADGRLADINCKARPCAIERGLESCALCEECPCEKLAPLLASREDQQRKHPDVPEEVYNLCMRQFDSIPRLIEIRRAAGLDCTALEAMLAESH